MGEPIYEYVVTVRQRKVSAEWQYPGAGTDRIEGQTDELDLGLDPLRMQTIKILQDWLKRWGVLLRLRDEYENLPVTDTFEVLGEHLYRMLFTGEVEEAFDMVYAAAEARDETLRVVLRFELPEVPIVDDIATYPWEFLYRPGPNGFFIAVATKFVLSRWMALGPGRTELPEVVPPLRVWFVMLTPEFEGFETEHKELVMTFGEIEDYRGALRPRAILRMTEQELQTELESAEDPPHIIHVVAVCRTAARPGGGKFEIAFRGQGGTVDWRDQDTLVGLLKAAIRDDWTPRMVVLHLCETSAVDYLATFGDLAPKLIRANFPAVLAMQYPLPAVAAKRFTSSFYQLLAEGRQIDNAVQKARESFHKTVGDRLFGAPVLYLQTVDGRLMRTAKAGPSVPTGKRRAAAPMGREALIVALAKTAIVQAPDAETGARVAEQVQSQAWPAALAEWDPIIRGWWSAEDDVPIVQNMYRQLLALVERERGVGR